MVAGVAIANAARKLIGTPFHFGGRLPGIGLDCAGVVVLAHTQNKLRINDPRHYSRKAILTGMIIKCLKETHAVSSKPQAGDVVLVSTTHSNRFTHCGILTGFNTMVHCLSHAGTTESAIPLSWLDNAVYMRHGEVV